jgi:hypothetical protein
MGEEEEVIEDDEVHPRGAILQSTRVLRSNQQREGAVEEEDS